jgi:hypothetical protein
MNTHGPSFPWALLFGSAFAPGSLIPEDRMENICLNKSPVPYIPWFVVLMMTKTASSFHPPMSISKIARMWHMSQNVKKDIFTRADRTKHQCNREVDTKGMACKLRPEHARVVLVNHPSRMILADLSYALRLEQRRTRG